MSALIPFLTLEKYGVEVQAWASRQLTLAGFGVVQTFDLQVARLAHRDCTCPHHGTAECDCQLVVLLIYPEHEEPSTLVIHSRDHRTELSLTEPVAGRTGSDTAQAVERILRAGLADRSMLTDGSHAQRSRLPDVRGL